MSTRSSDKLTALRRKWGLALHGNCAGCAARRRPIIKALTGENQKVALMFSGGLDSVYVAQKLKQDGFDVTLYHTHWKYDDTEFNLGERPAAFKIAALLALPIVDFGLVNSPVTEMDVSEDGSTTHIMRLPTIGAMLICHRTISGYSYIATGLHPSVDDRDYHWHELLQHMCDHCMPGVKMLHPADGMSRYDMAMALPEEIRNNLCICNQSPRCGRCAKCIEDRQWTSISAS